MSRKAKRMNTLYFEDKTTIDFIELPEGYFYKNHFYTESQCFTALLKDDEVRIHSFPNGTWRYNDTLYPSLEELYEWNEFGITYNELKHRYKELGVEHSPINCTLYSYCEDDYNQLYDSKGEVLLEIRSETNLIESVEDREEDYLDKITDDECRVYLKKSIKERIKILEEYRK